MTSRVLPESLKGQSSRDNKEWHKEMMAKFNKLNEEYNKRSENEFSKNIIVDNKDILNFDEDDVFTMIKKAKEDIKTINENNNELKKKIIEYEECKTDCTNIIETMNNISNTYCKISTKTQLYDISNKLQIKQSLIDFELSSSIQDFENELKIKIDELNEQIKNNNKKISDFKKLVLNCIDNEEKESEKNMCSVCVTRKINTCLNPCGHTFCLICVNKMNNKCGMCRATYVSKIKMYIADDELGDNEQTENADDNVSSDITSFGGFAPISFTSIAPTSFTNIDVVTFPAF